MQWFIDLVLEAIRIEGLAVNRGDPAAVDFQQAGLTLDGAFHDLDLSAIIPENVHAVALFVQVKNNIVGRYIRFRTKGNVNTNNKSSVNILVAGVNNTADVIVYPDADRKIVYWGPAGGWTGILITVKGWWY